MSAIQIGTNPKYRVFLGTGTMWLQEFHVDADDMTEAVDLVADYCEENELHGLYADHYEIFDLCEAGETVDEYADMNGLICCGNHGVYINIMGIEELQKCENLQ